MNLKRIIPFFSASREKDPLVRIEGSLTGPARLDEETLARLREVVKEVSARRPYTLDLDFSGGRFSLVMVEPLVAKAAFGPDPDAALARDLEAVLQVLPPAERSEARSTFRMLWREGGEVAGAAMAVKQPGRIAVERRIRPEEAYDRVAEEKARMEYGPFPRRGLPRWAAFLLALAALAAGSFYIYYTGPERYYAPLAEAVEAADLSGLEALISVEEVHAGLDGISFRIVPRTGYGETLARLLERAEGEDRPTPPELRARLAARALVQGRLNLAVFDGKGALLDRIPFDLGRFDGSAAVTVHARLPHLSTRPARARIEP